MSFSLIMEIAWDTFLWVFFAFLFFVSCQQFKMSIDFERSNFCDQEGAREQNSGRIGTRLCLCDVNMLVQDMYCRSIKCLFMFIGYRMCIVQVLKTLFIRQQIWQHYRGYWVLGYGVLFC
eukprot:TRINITY_DN14137_c0_g1_i9.p3 TRINITY_DN14137_c0_g1~~TRINITY_DN14137_c0_g1_i9.p3  ORF type:complete len:120 (-),score=7.76 TRINITY_DN14137_c0_g1_i9:79-438(-)